MADRLFRSTRSLQTSRHSAMPANAYSNPYSSQNGTPYGEKLQDTAKINLPVDSQTYLRA